MSQQSQVQSPQRQSAGCLAIISAVITGVTAGVIATLFGLGPIVGLVITAAVTWLAIRGLSKPVLDTTHATQQPASPTDSGIQPEVRLSDGSALRKARGERTSGGRAADTAPEGGVIVTIPFDPKGPNAEALITILELADTRIGYRDALVVNDEGALVVHAMARLTTDVEATGDADVGAAPIGRIERAAWQQYPLLGEQPTLVQVALNVLPDGSRRGWILFAWNPSYEAS
jgi:hypothetical protein